jgi:hypothetical protein
MTIPELDLRRSCGYVLCCGLASANYKLIEY